MLVESRLRLLQPKKGPRTLAQPGGAVVTVHALVCCLVVGRIVVVVVLVVSPE